MKNQYLKLLGIFIFLFFSCDEQDNFTCCDFEIEYSRKGDLKSTWNFVGYIDQHSGEEECVEDEGFDMNVQFQTDSTFRAKSTCNSLLGKYAIISENEIVFRDVIITLVACPDNRKVEIEEKYTQNLTYARYFRVEGNRLVITSISGLEMVFRVKD